MPHKLRFTSVFVCPLTGECFASGRYGTDPKLYIRWKNKMSRMVVEVAVVVVVVQSSGTTVSPKSTLSCCKSMGTIRRWVHEYCSISKGDNTASGGGLKTAIA